MKTRAPRLLCGWLLCCVALAWAGGATAGAAELRRDVVYGHAGATPLLLDAWVPDGARLHPVAILVHGGGWSGGDKAGSERPGSGNDITPWFAPLQAAGFTTFSINYRLAPEHPWPAGFEDVQTAIRWVKAHAAEFKGDAGRLALFGHSAGGQLVCLAAARADDTTRVQAVVAFAPPTDLVADTARRGGPSQSLQALFKLPPDGAAFAQALRDHSPVNQLRPGLPPFLLLHGDSDATVPLQMSVDFLAKLKSVGVPGELIVVPGAPHGLVAWQDHDPTVFARAVAWLETVLP